MEQALYLQLCSPHGAMFTGSGSDSLVINDALQMYLLAYLLTYMCVLKILAQYTKWQVTTEPKTSRKTWRCVAAKWQLQWRVDLDCEQTGWLTEGCGNCCGMSAGRKGGSIPGGGKLIPGAGNDCGGTNGRNCRRPFLFDAWPECRWWRWLFLLCCKWSPRPLGIESTLAALPGCLHNVVSTHS